MQILLTWKATNLSPDDANQRWATLLETWRQLYQELLTSDKALRLHTCSDGMLFCGLLSVPDLFRDWQEWHDDASHGMAWAGLAHNLHDVLPPQNGLSPVQRLLLEQDDHIFEVLEGRFIHALLDKQQHRLHVRTNALGLTPCFETDGKYGVAVGTRIAPLLDLVGRTATPNHQAMKQVFTMDWCLTNETTFEGVFQVDAGASITLDARHDRPQKTRYALPEAIIQRARSLEREPYLAIGSDAVLTTVKQQLRHSTAPLFDLTGGFDGRSLVSTAVASGVHPECDVSGLPNSQEVRLAAQVADCLQVSLHQLHPTTAYADELERTLRRWMLWTEGMIPAHISFAQSLMALSPARQAFFAGYAQVFNGGAFFSRTFLYNTDILVQNYTPDEIARKIASRSYTRFSVPFFSRSELPFLEDAIRDVVQEGVRIGLSGYRLFDFAFRRQRGMKWTGYMADMQQIGRHLFIPLCNPTLLAVSFVMTAEELLSGAWHYAHLRRVAPAVLAIPFLKDAPLRGMRGRLWNFSPMLFDAIWRAKMMLRRPKKHQLPHDDQEKLGACFHPFLREFLFSKEAWWPTIIPYHAGQMAWENFVNGLEAKPLWNLVTLEIWTKTFLSA